MDPNTLTDLTLWQAELHRCAQQGRSGLEWLLRELEALPPEPVTLVRTSVVLRRLGFIARADVLLRDTPHPLAQAQRALNLLDNDPALNHLPNLPDLAPKGHPEAQMRLDAAHGIMASRLGDRARALQLFRFAHRFAHTLGAERFSEQMEWHIRENNGLFDPNSVAELQQAFEDLVRSADPDPLALSAEARLLAEAYFGMMDLDRLPGLLPYMDDSARREVELAAAQLTSAAPLEPRGSSNLATLSRTIHLVACGLRAYEEGDLAGSNRLARQALEQPLGDPRDPFPMFRSILMARTYCMLGELEVAERVLDGLQLRLPLGELFAAAVRVGIAVRRGEAVEGVYIQMMVNAVERLAQDSPAVLPHAARTLCLVMPHAAIVCSRQGVNPTFAGVVAESVVVVPKLLRPDLSKRTYQRLLSRRKTGGLVFLARIPQDKA